MTCHALVVVLFDGNTFLMNLVKLHHFHSDCLSKLSKFFFKVYKVDIQQAVPLQRPLYVDFKSGDLISARPTYPQFCLLVSKKTINSRFHSIQEDFVVDIPRN